MKYFVPDKQGLKKVSREEFINSTKEWVRRWNQGGNDFEKIISNYVKKYREKIENDENKYQREDYRYASYFFGLVEITREQIKKNNADLAARFAFSAALCAAKASELFPLAKKGLDFSGGRDKGAKGEARKLVEALVKKHPNLKPRGLWEKFKSSKPKGWEFFKDGEEAYAEHDRPKKNSKSNTAPLYLSYKSFRVYVRRIKSSK